MYLLYFSSAGLLSYMFPLPCLVNTIKLLGNMKILLS